MHHERVCDRVVAQGRDVVSTESMVNIINSLTSHKIRAFKILETNMEKIDLVVKTEIKAVPNTTQIFQILWSRLNEEKLYLNYSTCSYCVVNGLYNHACCHFSLRPNNWTFEEKKTSLISATAASNKRQVRNTINRNSTKCTSEKDIPKRMKVPNQKKKSSKK